MLTSINTGSHRPTSTLSSSVTLQISSSCLPDLDQWIHDLDDAIASEKSLTPDQDAQERTQLGLIRDIRALLSSDCFVSGHCALVLKSWFPRAWRWRCSIDTDSDFYDLRRLKRMDSVSWFSALLLHQNLRVNPTLIDQPGTTTTAAVLSEALRSEAERASPTQVHQEQVSTSSTHPDSEFKLREGAYKLSMLLANELSSSAERSATETPQVDEVNPTGESQFSQKCNALYESPSPSAPSGTSSPSNPTSPTSPARSGFFIPHSPARRTRSASYLQRIAMVNQNFHRIYSNPRSDIREHD